MHQTLIPTYFHLRHYFLFERFIRNSGDLHFLHFLALAGFVA